MVDGLEVIFQDPQTEIHRRDFIKSAFKGAAGLTGFALSMTAGLKAAQLAGIPLSSVISQTSSNLDTFNKNTVNRLPQVKPSIPPEETLGQVIEKIKAFEARTGNGTPTIDDAREIQVPLVAKMYTLTHPDGRDLKDIVDSTRIIRNPIEETKESRISMLRDDYPQDHLSYEEAADLINFNPDALGWSGQRIYMRYDSIAWRLYGNGRMWPMQSRYSAPKGSMVNCSPTTAVGRFRSTLSHELFHSEVSPSVHDISDDVFSNSFNMAYDFLKTSSDDPELNIIKSSASGFRVTPHLQETTLDEESFFDEQVVDYLAFRLNTQNGLSYDSGYDFNPQTYFNLSAISRQAQVSDVELRALHRTSQIEQLMEKFMLAEKYRESDFLDEKWAMFYALVFIFFSSNLDGAGSSLKREYPGVQRDPIQYNLLQQDNRAVNGCWNTALGY